MNRLGFRACKWLRSCLSKVLRKQVKRECRMSWLIRWIGLQAAAVPATVNGEFLLRPLG